MNSARSRRTSERASRGETPLGVLLARFIQLYGMDTYRNAVWPTRDQVIPFQLFYLMVGAIANLAAAEQLNAYYAALLAGAQVQGGEEGRASRDESVRSLAALAHPEAPVRT
jgi:hypothetical protein